MYDPEVLLYPAKDLMFYQADIQGKSSDETEDPGLEGASGAEEVWLHQAVSGVQLEYLMPLEDVKGGIDFSE